MISDKFRNILLGVYTIILISVLICVVVLFNRDRTQNKDIKRLNTLSGSPGKDGTDGKNGLDGTDGKNGLDGANGKNGLDGANGKDGVNGTDGTDGKDGTDGVMVSSVVTEYIEEWDSTKVTDAATTHPQYNIAKHITEQRTYDEPSDETRGQLRFVPVPNPLASEPSTSLKLQSGVYDIELTLPGIYPLSGNHTDYGYVFRAELWLVNSPEVTDNIKKYEVIDARYPQSSHKINLRKEISKPTDLIISIDSFMSNVRRAGKFELRVTKYPSPQ